MQASIILRCRSRAAIDRKMALRSRP